MKHDNLCSNCEATWSSDILPNYCPQCKCEILTSYNNAESVPAETRVMPKIADLIENKKKKIDDSLREYLSENLTISKEREGQLKLIASCERAILTEIFTDIKSNFSV